MVSSIGELLVRESIISMAQLNEALSYQKQHGGRLGDSLSALKYISPSELKQFFNSIPPVPLKIDQTGLSETLLTDLLLKIAYFDGGTYSLGSMSKSMSLPMGVVDELTELARNDSLIAIKSAAGYNRASHVFELTGQGRKRAGEALEQSQYAGPAPVPLKFYSIMTAHQTVRQIEIDEPWVRHALSHMVVDEDLLDRLGPAFSSGRSIFMYGPPGTGKSSITESLARALTTSIYIPYAIEVGGQIIRLFDPAMHIPVEEAGEEGPQLDLESTHKYDPRWRLCRRPVVMVGGELTLQSLDLDFDPTTKFYEAPIHMKAANGFFILDDFGRQMVPPRQLLNRWIVPLERGTDFLSLHTGKKFEIPFDQVTVFCTNLKPSELVDEAFLRRIRHKVRIGYQTEEQFYEILRRICEQQGIVYTDAAARYLVVTYYRQVNRPLVGSHPRDLVEQIIDRARFMKKHPELTPETIDAAAENYFVDMDA
ncbi:MAG TPA: ATPase [Gallionella sp.]|nr:ATPase [Gallionella sp.]